MNVMLDEPGIRTAVHAHPDSCAERWWGKRLAAVQVDLERADPALLSELLTDAWEGKAPARLVRPAAEPSADRRAREHANRDRGERHREQSDDTEAQPRLGVTLPIPQMSCRPLPVGSMKP